MLPDIPAGWRSALASETSKPYYLDLQAFVQRERETQTIFPAAADTFAALDLTPLEKVRVVILGQDPYPSPGHAHGLSFSVRPGVATPKSLANIFKEAQSDVACAVPNNGFLAPWAQQGVLLLNAVLTVRAHEANSHKGRGWETFTDVIIDTVNAKTTRVVFVLWGRDAQKKASRIDQTRHRIVESSHPSPFSAARFFGSKPFSRTNAALTDAGLPPINWQIPNL
jgi:uracil-DNA glycosylase